MYYRKVCKKSKENKALAFIWQEETFIALPQRTHDGPQGPLTLRFYFTLRGRGKYSIQKNLLSYFTHRAAGEIFDCA